MAIYMSVGMCFEAAFGSSIGMILGADKMSIGIALGLLKKQMVLWCH